MVIAAGGVLLSRSTRGAEPPPTIDYREALVSTQRPFPLDPLLARGDPGARDLAHLTHRGLLRLDDSALPVPDLAASMSVSGDGLAYRFTIVNGRRWSDGSSITGRDVAATVAAVQQPGFPDTSLAASWKGVTVSIAPDSSVTMSLGAARASFASTVADLPLIPAAVAAQPLASLLQHAGDPLPTSGPMRVRDVTGDHLVLEANPYAPRAPHLRLVEIRLARSFDAALSAFSAGQVDGVEATTPSERSMLASVAGTRIHDTLTFRFVDLLFNARRPGLDDPVVRRAIASAIDRHAVISAALGGDAHPQVDAIPAGVLWLGAGSVERPDPQAAGRALDAAGWHVAAPDGVRARDQSMLSFTLRVPDAGPLPSVARAVASQLGAIGVGITVAAVPPASFAGGVLGTGAYDLAIADWDSGADPDVSSFWRSNAMPPSGFNVSGLPPDPFLDHALDTLAAERDQQVRQDAAARVNQRLAEDAPAVFLYVPQVSFAAGAVIRGIRIPPGGTPGSRYDGFADWRR